MKEIHLKAQIGLRATLKVTSPKAVGKGKVEVEQVIGDDFSRAARKWYKKTRVIDHRSDLYSEKVVDPETGATIHEQTEPLSKHVHHGSAKFKKPTHPKRPNG